jgi:hypothetical protein
MRAAVLPKRPMRVRPVQLVFIIILLSSLRSADCSVLTAGAFGIDSRYFEAVLCQDCEGIWTEIALRDVFAVKPVKLDRFIPSREPHLVQRGKDPGAAFHGRIRNPRVTDLPAAELAAAYGIAWAMKPPAAHCVSIYATTGSAG